jgi:hypothetical protein
MRTDRQTDNEANSRLRNFVNVPKNAVYIYSVTDLNYIHATGSQTIAYQWKCIFNMLLNLSKIWVLPIWNIPRWINLIVVQQQSILYCYSIPMNILMRVVLYFTQHCFYFNWILWFICDKVSFVVAYRVLIIFNLPNFYFGTYVYDIIICPCSCFHYSFVRGRHISPG